jgi:GTP-binding protein HflX
MITVLNKADRPEASAYIDDLKTRYESAIPLSAATGEGLPDLMVRMESILQGGVQSFRFPQARGDLAAMLHRSGTVLSEKYEGEFIEMEAHVDERTAGKLKEFVV